jgi:high-affinity Fe2+/Pb2+ permease
MAQQKKDNINKGSGVGIIVGVALGILVTLLFKKIGYGILMGIIVAFLLRRAFK